MKYDLSSAFERLDVPDELRNRVHIWEIPITTRPFSAGVIFHLTDTIVILTSGDQIRTDKSLMHELYHRKKGGVEDKNSDRSTLDENRYHNGMAVEHTLDRMLELELKLPGRGYLDFFDRYVNRIEAVQNRDNNGQLLARKLHSRIMRGHHYANLDLTRVKERRAELFLGM